jgi:hypothetical protein
MPELEHVSVSEVGYNLLKQGVRNWIEQDLGWKREDVFSVHFQNEILRDGEVIDEKGKQWKQWKQGKHVDVTLESMSQEKQHQRFVRLDDGQWQKEVEVAPPAQLTSVTLHGFPPNTTVAIVPSKETLSE